MASPRRPSGRSGRRRDLGCKKRSDAEEGGELFAPVGYIGGLVLTVIVAFIVAGIFDNDDLRVKRCMEQTGLPGVKCCGLLDIDAKKCITQALPKGKDAR